jgi:hypothetical protein
VFGVGFARRISAFVVDELLARVNTFPSLQKLCFEDEPNANSERSILLFSAKLKNDIERRE